MRILDRLSCRTAVCGCALVIASLATVENAYGLRPTKIPAELQTKTAEPRNRAIHLKLPLRQPVFHWSFHREKDLLAGKLILRILRGGVTSTIVIFENGKLSEGWEAMPFRNPKAGEIYFGFRSSKKYETAPGDRIEIELQVKEDLHGIGPLHTGILRAGTHKAKGSYSGLIDEYAIPDQAKKLPTETLTKLRQAYDYKAFLENWDEQWSLEIANEEGWLSPAERSSFKKLLKRLEAEDAKK